MRNILFISLVLMAFSCSNTGNKAKKNTEVSVVSVPEFSADSAYLYVKTQVDFGPRVPNTAEHKACGDYLISSLTKFGAEVTVQEADLSTFDGTILKAKNIIGAYNPEAETRILLFAHWDTRPWADNDKDVKNHKTPVLGANDGASGVGVLLELARVLNKTKPSVGVDIIFFDAEDYGAASGNEDSWCLGTQYWARNKHVPNYRARYGILLDMVGAPGATFYREQISDNYARYVVDKVWSKAAELGYGQYFVDKPGGAVTDDHVYVNQLAGIPAIDIIQYNPYSMTGFADYWHTVSDTMENIDANTLKVVGTTLLHVIYNEKP